MVANNIEVLAIPGHTSHILQPLDSTPFANFKTAWIQNLSQYLASNDWGDDGVEDAIQEVEEEAEVEAAAHAAELADQAYMAETLQIPSSMSTSAQEKATESTGKMARLKRVSLQIFIQLVFNLKHHVLYLLLNVPCHKTKFKMFLIVFKCECVFFRMRNFTSHTMKREEQFL